MTDDRNSPAKLRDAALELVAEGGMKAATVRAIAERAGLTQGLIRHHYGSLAGLIEACDAFTAEVIREAKIRAVDNPAAVLDPMASLRDPRYPFLMGYLAHRLLEDSPTVNVLVDQFIDDAEGYLAEARGMGLITDLAADRDSVAMMTIYALGSVVLHNQVRRLLNIDITSPNLSEEPGLLTYLAANIEVFGGLFSDEVRGQVHDAINALRPKE